MRFLVSIIIILLLTPSAMAQSSNDRCRWIREYNTPVYLDSLLVKPGSVTLNNETAEIISLEVAGKYIIRYTGPADSLRVCYKVLPLNLSRRYSHRTLAVYDSAALFTAGQQPGPLALMAHEELFPTEGIRKSGAIARGISFGNNQDVFVNSTLNLNLDGKLTDNLNIRASITDQNIPFQPEGNTQQLQDFDNVFIELYNEKVSVTAGDVVLRQQPGHFLRYYKNVQGGLGRISYQLGEGTATSSLGVSVAKGKFETTFITPREGVLGPYRIPGPEGQNFVIVLANSERVYLDGELLQRGFNLDYVIDYNAAQITFTNRVLITEFSRIRIDYEYSDQNYSRAIVAASHEQQSGKWTISAQAYSEADNRNQPLLIELDDEDKQQLSEAGDNLDQAVTSGVDSVAFSNEEVLYARRDTVNLSGEPVTAYVYSVDPSEAHYRIRFTQGGPNSGDYVPDRAVANGRIYKWVTPVDGVPQGNYSPSVPLPAPNKRQMATVGVSYQAGAHETVYTETAFSRYDRNLFSEKDSDDNDGMAILAGIRSEGRNLGSGYKLEAFTDAEWDHRNFSRIDRFRPIEFNRDWNFSPVKDTTQAAERILRAGVGAVRDNDRLVRYQLTYRNRDGFVDGFQHTAVVRQTWKKLQAAGDVFHMTNNTDDISAAWLRINTDLSYRHRLIVPGYRFRLDHNVIDSGERDSSYMYFDEHIAYLRSGEESPVTFDAQYSYRQDKRPFDGILLDYSTAHTTRMAVQKDWEKQHLQLTATYRVLDLAAQEVREETISGRMDWRGSFLENAIRGDVTYSISNSQELRREYVYISVPPGQGTHTWRDLNGDNVQDLNEFFIAQNPDERNYAKIFVPTDEFITAFQNLLVAQVQLAAPRSWSKAGGIRHLLSKFSNNTSWTADTKTTSDDLSDKLFAFARPLDASLILAERSVLRSTFFFNRSHAVYGAEFSVFDARNKQLLTNGFESQETQDYQLTLRYNPSRVINFKVGSSRGSRLSSSDFLENRNFLVDQFGLSPEVAWQPGNTTRFILRYQYEYKENNEEEAADAWSQLNSWQMEFRYNRAVNSALNARFNLINIEFEGDTNTPLGYELLNALNPGRNMTWSVNWQQRIAKGLQLSLIYDGRVSENTRVIHTGRVQVSALF